MVLKKGLNRLLLLQQKKLKRNCPVQTKEITIAMLQSYFCQVDKTVGDLIAEMPGKSWNFDGVITVEDSKEWEPVSCSRRHAVRSQGYISPYMISDADKY